MAWQKKTPGEASLMLAKYEEINRDIPRSTCRQLAAFVLAPKVGSKALDALFRRPMGQAPFYHRSWMWYTAMATSGLGHHWDELASRYNTGTSLHDCLIRLRRRASREEWTTLSRRLGIPVLKERDKTLNPYWWKPDEVSHYSYWTRGGVWDTRNPLTKIIVLGEHLDRDHSYNTVSQALTTTDTYLLEREVCNRVDEESLLYHQAVHTAVDYIRHRIPDLLGYTRPTTGYLTVSWFFQTAIPVGPRKMMDYESRIKRAQEKSYSRGNPRYFEWLPSLD